MKIIWCWRCNTEKPMLDEEEYAIAEKLYGEAIRNTMFLGDKEAQFKPLLNYYKKITGTEEEVHATTIMHHRLSLYGPPCGQCGKPYRTPDALVCGVCGNKRNVR